MPRAPETLSPPLALGKLAQVAQPHQLELWCAVVRDEALAEVDLRCFVAQKMYHLMTAVFVTDYTAGGLSDPQLPNTTVGAWTSPTI